MKQHLRVCLLFILSVSLLTQANGQVKKEKKETPKKTEKTKEVKEETPPVQEGVKESQEGIIEPPPPGVEMRPADTSDINAELRKSMPVPQVDFDTTAVPNDDFTKDILRLLTVTNALNLGILFAENMPKEYENNPTMKMLYARLIEDMRSGTSRRWFERVYVREYRKLYTAEDIKELLKFYDSPLGRKVVRTTFEMLPGITTQGKYIGAYMGAKLFMDMMSQQPGN